MSEGTHSVYPRVEMDAVYCQCDALMNPFLLRQVKDGGRWIFWRCSDEPDHVTSAAPLGHLRLTCEDDLP